MTDKTALAIGGSRTLGFALSGELMHRGWDVVVTVRTRQPEALRDSAAANGTRLTFEHLDITDQDQIAGLRERLADTVFDLLFVNAGITDADLPVGEVTTASSPTSW